MAISYITLQKRTIIAISGIDNQIFLQKIISNNINNAKRDIFLYTLLLTPQGKFLYDFFITYDENNNIYLLDCLFREKEKIIKTLSIYKLGANINITDASDSYKIYAIEQNYSDLKEQLKNGYLKNNFLSPDPRNKNLWPRLIAKDDIREIFPTEDFVEIDYPKYNQARILNLIPDSEHDLVSGESYPHDFNLEQLNAISYTKGCYIGQEVTARVHNKQSIRKKLLQIIEFEKNIILNDNKFLDNNKGIITSTQNNLGLALINLPLPENLDVSYQRIKGKILATAKSQG